MDVFAQAGFEPVCPDMQQILSETELVSILPEYEGWIIGDDPATEKVFRAGVAGRLRASVKWGVGVDNVDFDGARACGLGVTNTPGMFGEEVADIAMGYIIALARQTFAINAAVHSGEWIKPTGISLAEKTVAIVGLGDIGQATARRVRASRMQVHGYDPHATIDKDLEADVLRLEWPNRLEEADFVVLCCALNSVTRHLLNDSTLGQCKPGVRVVNVSRGPLIDETALFRRLESRHVHSAALEVFDIEPLPFDSPIRAFKHCIFGSHNASNTHEAVDRTSRLAISLLFERLMSSNDQTSI